MNPLLGSRKKESYHPRKTQKYIMIGQKKQKEPGQESEIISDLRYCRHWEKEREDKTGHVQGRRA